MERSQTEKRTVTTLMLVIINFLWLSVYVYTPILSPYSEGLGANYTMVGTILSSYGFVQLLLRIPIGVFSDSIGRRKPIILFGMGMGFLSSLGFFFAKSPVLLLLCRGGSGVAASCWAIFMTMYSGYFLPEEQAGAIGRSTSAMYIGQVLATFSGGIIAQYLSERMTFLFAAGAGLLGLLLCLKLPDVKNTGAEPVRLSRFVGLLQDKNLLFYSAVAVIMQLTLYTGAFGFIPNILRGLGADNFLLGVGSAMAALPAILASSLSGGVFYRTLGQRKTVQLGFVLMAGVLFITAFTGSIPVVLLMLGLSGFGRGLLLPVLTSLATRDIDASLRSSAVSFFQSVYGLGMTLGPIISGYLADRFSMTVSFIAIGFVTLLGFVMIAAYRDSRAT